MMGKLVPPNEIMFLESVLAGGQQRLPSLMCANLIEATYFHPDSLSIALSILASFPKLWGTALYLK